MRQDKKLSIFRWRTIQKSPKIWYAAIISIAVAVWATFPIFHKLVGWTEKTCNGINLIFQSLSLSYLAGMIFYVLSEFLPSTERTCNAYSKIQSYLTQILFYIRTIEAAAFGGIDNIPEEYNAEDFLRNIVTTNQYFTREQQASIDYGMEPKPISYTFFSPLSISANMIIANIDSIMAFTEYLSAHDVEGFHRLKTCRFLACNISNTSMITSVNKDIDINIVEEFIQSK